MSVTPPAKPRVGLFVLVTGFVISVVLVAFGAVFSIVEVSRAQRDVIGLFEDGERTTYLLGNLGKQLLRSHLILREVVSEGWGQFESTRTEALRIDADVSASTSELVPLLSPEERQEWNEIAPTLESLRNAHVQALRALEQENAEGADRVLDGVLPLTVEVSVGLTALSERNRSEIEATLQGAEQRLALVRLTEVILGGVLLVGIAISWLFAIQTIRRQRRRLDDFVLRLEAANRDLDAFAGRIAHDLRNVFGPISMAPDSLRAAGRPEAVEAVSQRLQRASSRAMALLDGLLAFSRAGEPSDEHATSSLREEIEDCIEELQR